jgi:hypothetical protein
MSGDIIGVVRAGTTVFLGGWKIAILGLKKIPRHMVQVTL